MREKRKPAMDIHRSALIIVVLTLVLVLAVGCTRRLEEARYTAATARANVLIAGDASAFKDRLRTRLITHYQASSNITVVNIDKLKQINTDDYHVVVIMDTCLAWSRFNMSTKAFLDRIRDHHKVVLFMTVDDTDWTFEHRGVDAMTAASVIADEERVFKRLRDAIDLVLSTTATNAARSMPPAGPVRPRA
jgi:hypothetical protein